MSVSKSAGECYLLRANPTFAIVAIVMLALGIGANTAILQRDEFGR
jgi:hypothetical protein